MLILVWIDVQFSQNAIFSFEKRSNPQKHFSSGSHKPVKNTSRSVHYFLTQTQEVLVEKEQLVYFETWVVNTYKYTLLTKLLGQWTTYCIALFYSMQYFGKLMVSLNGLVVNVLNSQSRSPVFRTIGWLQGQLSLSSFWAL